MAIMSANTPSFDMATKLVEACDVEGGMPCSWDFSDVKAAGEKFYGTQYEDELCSLTTAAPSPELSATQGFPTWGTQDFEMFENFMLADDGTMLDGMAEACAEQEGGVMFPEDFFHEDYGMHSQAMWGEECALGALAPTGCEEELSVPPGLELEELVPPPGLAEMDDQEKYLHDGGHVSLAGHMAFGEWAWRTAPRPQEAQDMYEPLVVRLGGAPDGSALLEAASGSTGLEELPKVLRCC